MHNTCILYMHVQIYSLQAVMGSGSTNYVLPWYVTLVGLFGVLGGGESVYPRGTTHTSTPCTPCTHAHAPHAPHELHVLHVPHPRCTARPSTALPTCSHSGMVYDEFADVSAHNLLIFWSGGMPVSMLGLFVLAYLQQGKTPTIDGPDRPTCSRPSAPQSIQTRHV